MCSALLEPLSTPGLDTPAQKAGTSVPSTLLEKLLLSFAAVGIPKMKVPGQSGKNTQRTSPAYEQEMGGEMGG